MYLIKYNYQMIFCNLSPLMTLPFNKYISRTLTS